jgi:hypothetical protein
MAVAKKTEIPKVNDDELVILAQKKLAELEQKLERAINRPSQAIEDDIRERAELLLSGKPPKPKEAPDEIQVLKSAVAIALGIYQQARKTAAERIITEIKPLHNKAISELLDAAEKFSALLLSQAEFVESCWHSGLYDFLDASWSLKWRIVLAGKPGAGSRLDSLVENLRDSLD